MIEFWRAGGGIQTIESIRATEAEGWDGQMFQDSLSLCPNAYVTMGACAASTTRLKLATGVTNPLTRHIALTASGAAGVHMLTGGRAVLGIGRGGLAPVPLADFEAALKDLQELLGGGKIEAPLFGDPTGFDWLPADLPKVPLDVAASGPKVIAMSSRLAERVTFSVGAIPERINWAVCVARNARAKAGLTESGISLGAQVIVICHPDRTTAIQYASIAVPGLVRFQVISGGVHGTMPLEDFDEIDRMRLSFDSTRRRGVAAVSDAGKTATSSAFVERFAVVGTPDDCIARLLELVKLGIERFVIVGPGFFPEPGGATVGLFASEVMPAIRHALEK